MALTGRRVLWQPPTPTRPMRKGHVQDRRIVATGARVIRPVGARIVRWKGWR